ncbi:MAG: CocE/NonD family hydrolase [Acidobacteriota bacterium]
MRRRQLTTALRRCADRHRNTATAGLVIALAASLGLGQRAGAAPQAATTEKPECTFTVEKDVATPMRDGTNLRSNVFTPDGGGPYPILMIRTPYSKESPFNGAYNSMDAWAGRCYIVVSQDVRGQYKSDGTFYPFRSEATDGYDAIEWAATLPKSNGKVGMYGFSYPGATQWLPAALRPPHLTAIIPAMTSSDYRDGWTYEGGALDQAFAQYWPMNSIANSAVRHLPEGTALDDELNAAQKAYVEKWQWFLPLKDYPPLHPEDPRVAAYHFDWLRHPQDDSYWQSWSIRRHWSDITVPAISFDGWYDLFLNGAIENFVGMRKSGGSKVARDGQRLVIGPWVHLGWQQRVGVIDFGPEAISPMPAMMKRWYDYWLKGIQNGVDKDPRVRVFVMGANQWRTANEWPIRGTEYRKYYLHSKGGANTASGDGVLDTTLPAAGGTPDKYSYDPKDPVPSIGGRFQQVVPPGPRDQRPVLSRKDVLVYTTRPLAADVEVTGPIQVVLYASSSATDTDFTAKLDDVYPDGTAMLISYGIQRARYRESQTREMLITPGQTYKYTIQVWPTSNLFKLGHRIRLEVSSSNFPMFDRNPNTGHPFGQDAELKVADQTILHDADHRSMITLPIIAAPLR